MGSDIHGHIEAKNKRECESNYDDSTYFQIFENTVQAPKEAWIQDLYNKIWGPSTNITKEVTTSIVLKLIEN